MTISNKNVSISNILLGVAVVVLLIAYFKGCFEPKKPEYIEKVVIDTVWTTQQSAAPIHSQPIIVATQPAAPGQVRTIREIIHQYDTAALIRILGQYYARKSYKDVLKLDSFGTVTLSDTVSQNSIVGRSFVYDLKIPTITKTVTKVEQYQPRNQVYLGGGVLGNQENVLETFKAGLLFKNKADQVIEVNGTINRQGKVGAEIGYYHLLKFKR